MIKGYGICQNAWWLDSSIKNELRLLLCISSLCAKNGYCYASNSWLSNQLNYTTQTVSTKIRTLIDKGYIFAEYEYRGAEVVKRYLKLNKTTKAITENDNRPLSKIVTDDYPESQPTIIENHKDNITSSIINTNRVKEKTYKKDFVVSDFKENPFEAALKSEHESIQVLAFLEQKTKTPFRKNGNNKILIQDVLLRDHDVQDVLDVLKFKLKQAEQDGKIYKTAYITPKKINENFESWIGEMNSLKDQSKKSAFVKPKFSV